MTHNSGRREEERRIKAETTEPEKPLKAHEDVWRRTTVGDRAHVLHGIAELLHRDREEVAQLESRHTGKPLCRTRVDATVATRYFEFYANTMESFYEDTNPVLEDKFGSWRQPESWT
jgi:aldehyde dehydrogenase (NAD+)